MEENKTQTRELNSAKETEGSKVDAAQVQAIIQQTQVRMQQLTENVKQLDQMLRDKTIDQLFNVIKHASFFDPEFVDKCAKGIETYLTAVAFTPESVDDKQEKVPEVPVEEA